MWKCARGLGCMQHVLDRGVPSDRDVDRLTEWVELTELLQQNEPRFLRMLVARGLDLASWAPRLLAATRQAADGLADLPEEDDSYVYRVEAGGELVAVPIEPSTSEARELEWCRSAEDLLHVLSRCAILGGPDVAELQDKVREHREVRERRQERWEEFEYNESAEPSETAAPAGTGFDLAAIFADL